MRGVFHFHSNMNNHYQNQTDVDYNERRAKKSCLLITVGKCNFTIEGTNSIKPPIFNIPNITSNHPFVYLIQKWRTGFEWNKQLHLHYLLTNCGKNWHIRDILVFCETCESTIQFHFFPDFVEVGSVVCCWLKVSVNSHTKFFLYRKCQNCCHWDRRQLFRHTGVTPHLTCKLKSWTCLFNNGHYSHLRGPSPPALVSHAEATKALSLGHFVLARTLVLPARHRGRGFLLQLRQMLHAAVHLQGNTVRSIIIWSVCSY